MSATAAVNADFEAVGTRWRTVLLLFCIACLNYADRTAISAVFPLLKAEFGMSDVALAGLGSLFLWSYAAGSPFAGMLADRFSRKRMVIISLIAWSAVTIWTGLAQSTGELLLTRVVLGIAECAYLPAAIALIADHHGSKTRGTALAIHLCGLNLGLVAGGGLAGYLGEEFGWRSSFIILGIAGFVLGGIAAVLLTDGPRASTSAQKSPPIRQALPVLLRTKSYLIILAEAMLIAVGVWMFFNWMPLYFKEAFGLSLAVAGLSGTMALQLSAAVGILAGGYLSDRVSRGGLHRRMLLMAIAYAVGAPALLVFFSQQQIGIVAASVVLFSFMRALGAANEGPAICDLLPPLYRSTALGINNMLNCVAGGVGILLAGVLKQDFGLSGVFAGVSVLVIIAAALSFLGFSVYMPRDLKERRT